MAAWVAEGEGATFTDVDGHTYVDFYIADMSGLFCCNAKRGSSSAMC
jgi:glutamate-1-semialdehyde aminotransferase